MFVFNRLIKKTGSAFYRKKEKIEFIIFLLNLQKKSFVQSFVDYLGSTNVNLIP